MTMKLDLRNASYDELKEAIKKMGLPAFRFKQIFSWVHKKGAASFDDMKNIPKELRAELAGKCSIAELKQAIKQTAKDGTAKYIFELPDGSTVEAVLLDDDGRKTVCLSTQVGCRMNCGLCATARVKFVRDLTAGEMVSQVYQIEREAGRVSNVVYMGMGEPLDNYDNVLKSIKLLNHPEGKNIGQRHITVSTCGLIPQIMKLADEKTQIRLAISLNFADEGARDRFMPINKKYSTAELIKAAKEYIEVTGRRITFEYVLVAGVNDSQNDANRLADLLRGIKANVNLIPFNPINGSGHKPSERKAAQDFRAVLEGRGLEVSQRFKRGEDIDAACGQLTGKRNAAKD
jgi:23S rRNA (adenine2503-C2)-methyltransferase